ncbi:MAG: ATP-binding cassette domain-containing protein [Thermoplasmata archaeon]
MVAGEVGMDTKPIIELINATKTYGSGETAVKAVDGVDLHIPKGEITCIMGPSGSGKTTLVQLIGALLKPTSGEVVIDGRKIAALREKELSVVRLETFGFIFQTPNLLESLTALQNVELVLNMAGIRGERAKDIARKRLRRLKLDHRLSHEPSKLSGGEQQRVAIARALANDPQVILADEPTANLDSKTGYAVVELLRKIAKQDRKTVVIVTHDLRIRYLADRVLWLEDGRLSVRWSDGVTVDPVCLMVVERARTHIISEYQGKRFFFCSGECKKEFEKDPAKYGEVGP